MSLKVKLVAAMDEIPIIEWLSWSVVILSTSNITLTPSQQAARAKLLSDNGPGYISRAFRDYLKLVEIKHILAAPYHPQTNGKLERYHQTLKRDVNQVPYEMPSDLEEALAAFVSYYNYRRYHKALGNVTPADVLNGRKEKILQRRSEVNVNTARLLSHSAGQKLSHSSGCFRMRDVPFLSGNIDVAGAPKAAIRTTAGLL